MTATPDMTTGIHHLGLSVPNVGAARDFFVDALGFEQVGEVPDYPAIFVSDGTVMLTLWQVQNPDTAAPFDRRKAIGLHHLALRVDDLEAVYARLRDRSDVQVEFAPEPLRDGPTRHMMCAIPGGVRVEFIAPAA